MPRQDAISGSSHIYSRAFHNFTCYLFSYSLSFLFPDPYPAAQGNLEQEVSCWWKGVGQRKEGEEGGMCHYWWAPSASNDGAGARLLIGCAFENEAQVGERRDLSIM